MASASGKKNPVPHLCGSGIAALINFPLWKASAMAQSGYKVQASGWGAAYVAAVSPPYRGALAVVGGMTWARAAIFYGSERGRPVVQQLLGESEPSLASMALPPLVVSTMVQIVNQPLVRGSIHLQDPTSPHHTVAQALRAIARERGLPALWHGTTAGVAKTVPKYCVAVVIKDTLEQRLPRPRPGDETANLARSAVKACTAATAGALLTNPLDVLRNEMFKTNLSMARTAAKLNREYPNFAWFARGAEKNLVAVAVPVACTIFFTDQLARLPLFATN
mmetsp:Transcript_13971/g.44116  ORF Transcript_13971/g.44116 Transcript_13971/m.44116 type:complete len:278 (+) Transcript_13971:54-887(+)|eukprot:CAMPEP_0197389888 /NCGR_PEP_ID=MMETSP1165-20131217/2020_1 /TAXON_ID=284809 /ORGANISM="Chrysocystis fragilis, Strain CCMP3189" /LENGTH=277 /DNA_ID=CAMNT_0042915337 /DNA_START=54 /DNA_END=887 /DNA_ORIENTATION=-